MRIIQLIDSLEAGGAEQMAVNYANALLDEIEFSGLVTTRAEGSLFSKIDPKVSYFFLKKKKTIDIKAILKLKKICKENNISYIHAHGSSFFTALLLKFLIFKIKIIWHDHNGFRINTKNNFFIIISSIAFHKVIVVNKELECWARKKLFVRDILYLPNFIFKRFEKVETILKGVDRKRIVCIANLRNPKNHIFLLKSFFLSNIHKDGWTLHFIGKNNFDNYSKELEDFILKNKLEEKVFIYNACNDVLNILKQCDIAALVSTYEGLPVSLIEYGYSKKAVISTKVGEIPNFIKNEVNGVLINSNEENELIEALLNLSTNENKRKELARNLYKTIQQNFSKETVLKKYLSWI